MPKMNIKVPWVFYISIRQREWFSKFWKTRGANFIEFQLFRLQINIGLPWKKIVVISHLRDYNSIKSILETNKANLKNGIKMFSIPYSIHIARKRHNENKINP